jgi:hypothetical protein
MVSLDTIVPAKVEDKFEYVTIEFEYVTIEFEYVTIGQHRVYILPLDSTA